MVILVNYGRVIYIYTLHVSSYSEVKRVYGVYQYIFSGEGEYALDIHHIFSQHNMVKENMR
jgi:hypothetical protein